MDQLKILEHYYNRQVNLMRNDPVIKEYFRGAHGHDFGDFAKTENGETIYIAITHKQITVYICEKNSAEDKYNFENSPSLTRNMPHDIQRWMKDKDN